MELRPSWGETYRGVSWEEAMRRLHRDLLWSPLTLLGPPKHIKCMEYKREFASPRKIRLKEVLRILDQLEKGWLYTYGDVWVVAHRSARVYKYRGNQRF